MKCMWCVIYLFRTPIFNAVFAKNVEIINLLFDFDASATVISATDLYVFILIY